MSFRNSVPSDDRPSRRRANSDEFSLEVRYGGPEHMTDQQNLDESESRLHNEKELATSELIDTSMNLPPQVMQELTSWTHAAIRETGTPNISTHAVEAPLSTDRPFIDISKKSTDLDNPHDEQRQKNKQKQEVDASRSNQLKRLFTGGVTQQDRTVKQQIDEIKQNILDTESEIATQLQETYDHIHEDLSRLHAEAIAYLGKIEETSIPELQSFVERARNEITAIEKRIAALRAELQELQQNRNTRHIDKPNSSILTTTITTIETSLKNIEAQSSQKIKGLTQAGQQYAEKTTTLLRQSYGQEPLNRLLTVPSMEQLTIIMKFQEELSRLKDGTLPLTDAAVGRMNEFIMILADLHSAVLVHQCPLSVLDQILSSNSIKSSREITKETGQEAGHSAVARKYGGLPYVTFALNGTDSSYGYPQEERGKHHPDKYTGAIILLPMSSIGNRPFFVAGKNLRNSGHQSFENEVHAFPVTTGTDNPEDISVSIPLEGATILLPHSETQRYATEVTDRKIQIEGYGDDYHPDRYINQMKRERRMNLIQGGLPFSFTLHPFTKPNGEVARVPIRMQAGAEPLFQMKHFAKPIRIKDTPDLYNMITRDRPIIT